MIDGNYLGHEICAFSGTSRTMWLIVKHISEHAREEETVNYMLFNRNRRCEERYGKNRFPVNDADRQSKDVEYYSSFDNALDNLMRVIVNKNSFKPTFLKEVFE